MVTDAIGGGLIAAGAVLLLATILRPPAESLAVGASEYLRQRRNTHIATIVSGVSTLAGAALVLIGSAWPYAFLGAALALCVYYPGLVGATYRAQQSLLTAVRRERVVDGGPGGGRITVQTAACLGLVASADELSMLPPMFWGQPGAGDRDADEAQALAERRAALAWALRHPYGRNATGIPTRLRLIQRRRSQSPQPEREVQ